MKHYIVLIALLFIVSCAKAPECKYEGDFNEASNAGCLIIDNNKVLFVESRSGKLGLPGGGLASGEAPQCTAEREVWEETGIEVVAKERMITYENGFQLFKCEVIGKQVMDGSNRPWRLEVEAVHWLAKEEFDGKDWRFPEQVAFIREQLESEHIN